MFGSGGPPQVGRALKAGGPPAVITAGLGVGATGVAGPGVEAETEPVATGAARAVGADPTLGPILLVLAGALVLGVAFFVPGLFEGSH